MQNASRHWILLIYELAVINGGGGSPNVIVAHGLLCDFFIQTINGIEKEEGCAISTIKGYLKGHVINGIA